MTEQRWDAEREGCQTGLTGVRKRGEKSQRLKARRGAKEDRQTKDGKRMKINKVCVLHCSLTFSSMCDIGI